MSMEAATPKPRKARRSSRSKHSGTICASVVAPPAMVPDQPTERLQSNTIDLQEPIMVLDSPKDCRAVQIPIPDCPECGAPMELRHRHSDKQPFWGCVAFPVCRGSTTFKVLQPPGYSIPEKVLVQVIGRLRVGSANALEHEDWVDRILELGEDVFGSYAATRHWLEQPRIALRGVSPMKLMKTIEGCWVIIFMLETFYDCDLTTTAVPR